MKIHEGVLNRYVTCNNWTVYLDERGMPIGFEPRRVRKCVSPAR